MSHFTVLVVGENPEGQLKPFDENLRVDFKDKTEEYRQEYETECVSEFYCCSHSSWGYQITKELFEELKKSKIGRVIEYEVTKLAPLSYLTKSCKYRGYYELENGRRCKGDAWFEVENVLNTTHPDKDVCFEGKVLVRKIKAPKRIPIKDKYPVYEEYLKHYHGVDDVERQGYDYNPKAKWDWYQLGGRWTGYFRLKPRANGILGTHSLVSSHRAEIGTADQALKKDIDFDAMLQEQFELISGIYDKYEKASKSGELKPAEAYWEYGIENMGEDADHYIPETREEFLKRRAPISTFAVLKDGEWYERGKMGWWGIVTDEKGVDEWHAQFEKLIKELPDDTLLSLYDCHI